MISLDDLESTAMWSKETHSPFSIINPDKLLKLVAIVRLAKHAQHAANSSIAMFELREALKEIK
jgi:hypothetical protein